MKGISAMKRFLIVFMFSLCALTLSHAEDEAPEYSATMIVTFAGKPSPASKVYVSKSAVRVDLPNNNYMVVNIWSKKASIINLDAKMYLDQEINLSRIPRVGKKLDEETGRTLLGHETVNGYDVDKYFVTHGAVLSSETMTQWLRKDNIAVKVGSGDEYWTFELKDIQPGKQRTDLFDIPSDFRHVDAYGRDVIDARAPVVQDFKKR